MNLSDLHTGERGVIVKVTGHGGFRKRIVEMGFIRGKVVEVLLNAPLQDPVKYKIMGYEVSLRRSEAAMIEVVSEDSSDCKDYKSFPDCKDYKSGRTDCKDYKSFSPYCRITNPAEPDPAELNSSDCKDYKSFSSDCKDYKSFSRYCRITNPAELAELAELSRTETDKRLTEMAERKRRNINVALVGNPNCGKTSLFNFASGSHERVGNYSGVTVDAKEGHAEFEGYRLNLVDLPGTYSLSAYSPEELYVRKYLTLHTPDIVINVIDTSNLERNLYLTTQLIDMHLRMVVALNMFDETEKRGDYVDIDKLSELFGCPMVPTVFTSGKGVEALFQQIIVLYESQEDENPHFRHIHINHGHEIEHGIEEIQEHLKQEINLRQRYSTRYLSIKLLERDKEVEDYIRTLPDAGEILAHRDEAARRVKEETGNDSETAVMDAKYGFIHGALKEACYHTGNKEDTYLTTHVLDSILTNRWIGFPVFLLLLTLMFTVTFRFGQYPMDWIEAATRWVGEMISVRMSDGLIKDMLIDGVIGGVGSVIVFLPQILILYFFISFMEDCGYMSRAAFIMDRLMHKMGLHGKSFIPLIMGFGCNVPAVMATRTIESRKNRLVTMLILPLMSCEARIPIYIMIIATFFAIKYQSIIMMLLYIVGMALAVLMSKLLTLFVIKGEDTPFVMELPPYRFPTWKAVSRHTWEKGKQYLKKMGGIILVASIVVWALGYFPHNEGLSRQQQQEQSYIGQIGKTIEPIFRPQGFNWKLDVGIVSGVGAKEIVASTIGVLYSDDESFADDNSADMEHIGKYERLRQLMSANGVTSLSAICFLLFVLIYFPCIATLSAIKGETGRWRWAVFVAGYTTILAWVVSAVVYQVGIIILLHFEDITRCLPF